MEKTIVRQIPERLMPDANYQFLIHKPYALVFDPEKPLPDYLRDYDLCNHPPGEPLPEPPPGSLVQREPEQYFLYDSWDIELACALITLGYPVHLEGMAEEVKGWPLDCEGRDRFNAMCMVFDRALAIAQSSVKADTIKEHDTPANWIEWAEGKGYSVAHLMPADAHAGEVETKQRSITKQQVINAFDGLHFDCDQWSKALSNVPKWLEPCRVSRGRKGDKSTSATWNPVQIAAALYGDEGKGITIKKLDAVFVRLKDWADEWHEVSESFTD